MNCFVIMPFASEFDDVYEVIRQAVSRALAPAGGRCFRLDDTRPAGRITKRLITELESATLCVADLTDCKPNVMWELGFAMALQKPTIIITQGASELPFDIKDMQCIAYKRAHLSGSLGTPLHKMVIDTLGTLRSPGQALAGDQVTPNELSRVLAELAELKKMFGDVVRAGVYRNAPAADAVPDASSLVGNWLSTSSHVYCRVIDGHLVAAYCYGGNEELTGVYHDWQRTGDYWFARFRWLHEDIAGFSFLKHQSLDVLEGAWWYGTGDERPADAPREQDGTPARWERMKGVDAPAWASEFFLRVAQQGLEAVLKHAEEQRRLHPSYG